MTDKEHKNMEVGKEFKIPKGMEFDEKHQSFRVEKPQDKELTPIEAIVEAKKQFKKETGKDFEIPIYKHDYLKELKPLIK